MYVGLRCLKSQYSITFGTKVPVLKPSGQVRWPKESSNIYPVLRKIPPKF